MCCTPRSRFFELCDRIYLGEIETECENTLACLSGAQMGSNYEKNWRSKISWHTPFKEQWQEIFARLYQRFPVYFGKKWGQLVVLHFYFLILRKAEKWKNGDNWCFIFIFWSWGKLKVKKWGQLVLHFHFLILRKAESKKMGTVGASFSFSDPEESWKWKNWHGFRRTFIESVVRKAPCSLDLKGLKSFFHLHYIIYKV